jgi:cell division protein FtsB
MIRKLAAGAILLAALYFLTLGGDYTFLDLWRMGRDLATETTALDSVRAEVVELEARADSLASDSATLERLAREQYGLIKDGERLYRFAEPDSAAVT